MTNTPTRQIRANYNDQTIRIYQAYSHQIADSALQKQTFISPPFKMERMTWIKPSFLWMMCRAGWGFKDEGQRRILAIDISREGFEWALAHSCLSHPEPEMSTEQWQQLKQSHPVRVQWDPERDLYLQPQTQRAIQIGLSGDAVNLYVQQWIKSIEDVTGLAHQIHEQVKLANLAGAEALLPVESLYPMPSAMKW